MWPKMSHETKCSCKKLDEINVREIGRNECARNWWKWTCKKLESWDDLNVQEIGIVSIWKKRKILWRIYEKWPIYVKISLILSWVLGNRQKYKKSTEKYKNNKEKYRKKRKKQKNTKKYTKYPPKSATTIQKSQNSHDSWQY